MKLKFVCDSLPSHIESSDFYTSLVPPSPVQVQREREFKTKMIKNHIGQCSCKLKQTTGLLEYAIEVMKEQDPASFLMVIYEFQIGLCSPPPHP